ncbi:Helix-turn-helix domain-containing protein [Actinopolyspora alba]|uniref:Helix-turn-helix domain-containing protein n=1 Tax=Actinopolyspora alba TaxID=673379 RepID=A0A1I1UHP2_9ACTN|nr:helix-turn-helix transcriptional regulator [Actinopolyspora alba]SFD70214.1 Helix-turn-helix domain-containing protein [Actinopolyspora alba]
MAETNPAPRAYLLGSELRYARTQANLTMRDLAARLDVTHTVIVRWENGSRVPSSDSVSAVCAVLGLSSAERDRLTDMARAAANEPANSVSVGQTGAQDQLAALLEYERNASTITDVAPVLMPGLTQTSDYVRAIVGTDSDDVDKWVNMRLGRKDIITRRRNAAHYVAFLLEAVLYQRIGDRDTHVDQLYHLAELGKRDNVEIRVIPATAGWTPAHTGPFVLLEFSRAEPVVHLEHHRSSATLRDDEDVTAYLDARDHLARVAMNPEDSIGHIAAVADRLENTA